MKPNRDLISSFKNALKPKLPKKQKRHSGDEITRWFQAYDVNRWEMPFDEALQRYGYRGTAATTNRGLRPEEIAQRVFPESWRVASRNERGEEASPEFRESLSKCLQAPNLTYPEAEKMAAAKMGIDLRSKSVKTKKIIQKIKDYIENAETWIYMSYDYKQP